MGKYNVKKIEIMESTKKASLCIAGSSPFVISINITRVNKLFESNHKRLQSNKIAKPKKKLAIIKKISFVSK